MLGALDRDAVVLGGEELAEAEAARPFGAFRHEALLHSGPEDFLTGAAGFVSTVTAWPWNAGARYVIRASARMRLSAPAVPSRTGSPVTSVQYVIRAVSQ